MPTTDCATDISLPPSSEDSLPGEYSHNGVTEQAYDGTPKLLRGLLYGFAGTVTIGLTLASWYVGVRIVASGQAAPPSAISAPTNSRPAPPLASPPAVAPETVADDSMAEAYWYAVPPPVELYLQVAGLGPKQDAEFVRSLQSKGFRAQLQNPEGDNARILIGPFSTRAEMEQKQRKLQSGGVLAVQTGN
jgi:hypothetical protein